MLFCVLFRFWIIRSDAKRRETYNYTGEALYGPFARAPAFACITEPWKRVTTLDGERPSNRLPRYSRLAVCPSRSRTQNWYCGREDILLVFD